MLFQDTQSSTVIRGYAATFSVYEGEQAGEQGKKMKEHKAARKESTCCCETSPTF